MRPFSGTLAQHVSRKYLKLCCGKNALSPANGLPRRSMRESFYGTLGRHYKI
jgi:hypothetical protein